MKRYNIFLQFLIILFVANIAMSCILDDDEGDTDGDTDGDIDTDGDVDGDVGEVVAKYNSGDTATLKFTSGDEVYQIVPYFASTVESEAGYSITVGDSSANGTAGKIKKTARSFRSAKPEWISEVRYRQVLARQKWSVLQHQLKKQVAAKGVFNQDVFKSAKINAKLSSECASDELYRDGVCTNEFDLTFMDFDEDETEITVQVKAKGEHVAVVVDSDDTVAQADIDNILNKFDTIIYPRNQFFSGGSTFDGIDYVDRDGDGMHMIVLTHLVNDMDAVGLFNPADFGPDLNVSDILYVVLPDADNPMESILGTIAHEYYHMLMYGIKRAKFGTLETLWLDEDLAHLFEDVSGYGGDNLDITAAYLESPANTTWAFSFDNQETEARGMGYLIMRYLFEQKGGVTYSSSNAADITDNGGATFIASLLQTDNKGFDAIDDALSGSDSWKNSFFDWLAAVSLDETSMNAGSKYGYNAIETDSITGQKRGVCTHCSRDSIYGYTVDFDGLSTTALSGGKTDGIVSASGAVANKLTGNSDQEIVLQADDDDILFGVFRVK